MDWIGKLVSVGKIPTNIIVLVCLVSGILLFSPETWVEQLSLVDFKKNYGQYFGITFITTLVFLIILIVNRTTSSIKSKKVSKKFKKIIEESIDILDYQEKAVLREFYMQSRSTIQMPINDPTVSALMSKGILYQVGNYGRQHMTGLLFNLAISDLAKKKIQSNGIECIGLPSVPPEDTKLQEKVLEDLMKNRPPWMMSIQRDQRLFDGF